ncbi:hypothetical protein [Pontibacter rugosus]|uniref:Uncharacterized protein n=1 Tax=Pontibacter rugosus TaxID=1745966 RepID=A0ABW3SMG1_9BACT
MKRVTAALASILTLGAFSCDDETVVCPEMPESYIMADKNTASWLGQPELRLDNDTLWILGVANKPNDEVLVMKIKYNGTGTYALHPKQGYYYTTVGGDVLTSEYKLAKNTVGTLKIIADGKTEGVIEGSFDLALRKVRSNPESSIESINFTDGRFRGQIAD